MKESGRSIYGNPLPPSSLRSAERLFRRYAKRFHFDPSWRPRLAWETPSGPAELFGIRMIEQAVESGTEREPVPTTLEPSRDLVIGTIRMGFGHYRMAIAIASAAHHAGMRPWWLDFLAFPGSAASSTISHLEHLYALGSRMSQRSKLFNRYAWERITSDVPHRLSYVPRDDAICRLFVPLPSALPAGAAFAATHPWTARAAIEAGANAVVNVVPDNYPMAFHVVEGALHAIQTPSAYFGYRALKDMGPYHEEPIPMPDDAISFTGHFVDHEIVENVDADCERRLRRLRDRRPRRLLLTIGGSGAQVARFIAIIRASRPSVEAGELSVLVNMGDLRERWKELQALLQAENFRYHLHSEWKDTSAFARETLDGDAVGIHVFLHDSVFPAVYTTNVLLRCADIMVTKPSELSFYPVPKLFIQRVGRHEMWGAIRGAEIGDGTLERRSSGGALQSLRLFLSDDDLLTLYSRSIVKNKSIGIYDGAYNVVKLAKERALAAAR